MNRRAFLAALGPAAARVLPLALVGWVIASLIMYRSLVWETLWIVPVPAAVAVVVAALLLARRRSTSQAQH